MRGLPIGYSQSWKRLRYETKTGWRRRPGESSLLLLGPARSGKTSIIVPQLLEFEGSVICPDVKAQISSIVAGHRRQRLKQRVVFINPLNEQFERLGRFPHVSINPLDDIKMGSRACGLQADAIGESIVLVDDHEHERHWPESGRDLVSGFTLGVCEYEPPEKRNLVTVYERICSREFFEYVEALVRRGHPLIVNRLARFTRADAPENKELASIHSTTMTQFRFMGNQAVIDCLRPSRSRPLLRWQDLRKHPTTVFPIIPVQYLSALGRFLRLVMSAGLRSLIATGNTDGLPVYLPWDEFPACGHMSVVSDVMALSAGMNLTMMIVAQDASQLKAIYGDRLNSFLSVAGCQLYLPPRDPFTARLISEAVGQTEIVTRSRSVTIDNRTGEPQVNDSVAAQARALMLPDEVMALGRRDMLIRVEGVPDVIRAKTRGYWESPEYRGLYDRDPYHPKRTGGLLRKIFGG